MAINLSKGSKIDLTKNGKNLEKVCVGLNWGAIRNKSFFGLMSSVEDVDLDGSAAIFNADKQLIEAVYFRNLLSKDGAVTHSGDDLSGDSKGDDGKDNEVITIDFLQLNPDAQTIILFLNSYQKQDFSTIPYSKIQIFEGTPKKIDNVLASFNLSADKLFAGYVSMIMGRFDREGSIWKFQAVGEPLKNARVFDTIDEIKSKYL